MVRYGGERSNFRVNWFCERRKVIFAHITVAHLRVLYHGLHSQSNSPFVAFPTLQGTRSGTRSTSTPETYLRLRFKLGFEGCPDGVHNGPRSSDMCSGVSNSIPRSSARALASLGRQGVRRELPKAVGDTGQHAATAKCGWIYAD